MKKYFVDMNVVVYANDRNAGAKQTRAIEVLTTLMRAQNGVISIQVLQEYANTALTKLNQDASEDLNTGQHYAEVAVANPFAADVDLDT